MCRFVFGTPEWNSLPVPEGCTVTWDGALMCEARIGTFCADMRRCRLRVPSTAHWRATAAPTGIVFIELLQDTPAEVTVTVGGQERTLALAPGRIVTV